MKKNNQHIEIDNLFALYRGELGLEQINRYMSHIDGCDECSTAFEAMKAFEDAELRQPSIEYAEKQLDEKLLNITKQHIEASQKNNYVKKLKCHFYENGWRYLAAVAASLLLIVSGRPDRTPMGRQEIAAIGNITIKDCNHIATRTVQPNVTLSHAVAHKRGINNMESEIESSVLKHDISEIIVFNDVQKSINIDTSHNPKKGYFEVSHPRTSFITHPELPPNIRTNLEDMYNDAVEAIPQVIESVEFLKNLYDELGGLNWVNGWDISHPISTWEGVMLNDYGDIVGLDFTGWGLGELPEGLHKLQNLTFLSLEENELTTFPANLPKSLKVLNLSSNNLSSIPPEIGNLSNLENLYLSSNQLNGEIPVELGNLDNLVHLSLRNNNLTGNIPPELAHLNNLRHLDLASNQLSGCYYPNLKNLTTTLSSNSNAYISVGNNFDVTWEDFCNNEIGICYQYSECRKRDSLALIGLYSATNGSSWINTWNLNESMDNWFGVTLNANGCITNLNLSSNDLTGYIPKEISYLDNMIELSLVDNELVGSIPTEISNLSNLRTLSLYSNNLSGKIPNFSNLLNIRDIHLYNNQLSGHIPNSLAELPNLKYLSLSNNQLKGKITKLINSPITYLNLDNNKLIYDPKEVEEVSRNKILLSVRKNRPKPSS